MALPLALARVTRGFAELSPPARRVGTETAALVSRALSAVLGDRVQVEGAAVDSAPVRAAGMAVVAFALQGAGAAAGTLELDAALLARLLGRLSARTSALPSALVATDVERMLLTVLALVAADAATSSPAIRALVPRVLLDETPPAAGAVGHVDVEDLSVALEVRLGDDRGRGQLRVPAAAIRALASMEPARPVDGVAVEASWREGAVTLAPDELAALACGDVLLLDEGPRRAQLVLPGGLTIAGTAEQDAFHVEEIRMTEAQAAFPITLTVEIARVTLTLGELARTEPGATLALGARKDGAVVLRAGEHPVARGQLVEVEGALGVRIAQLGGLP
jgi:type III secretion protein Q